MFKYTIQIAAHYLLIIVLFIKVFIILVKCLNCYLMCTNKDIIEYSTYPQPPLPFPLPFPFAIFPFPFPLPSPLAISTRTTNNGQLEKTEKYASSSTILLCEK